MAETAKDLIGVDMKVSKGLFSQSPLYIKDYTETVKNPIDLSEIEGKCRVYASIDDFRKDLDLLLSNGELFNPEGSEYRPYVQEVVRVGRGMLDKLAVEFEVYKKAIQLPPPSYRAGTDLVIPKQVKSFIVADWGNRGAEAPLAATPTPPADVLAAFLQSKNLSRKESGTYQAFVEFITACLASPDTLAALSYPSEEGSPATFRHLLRLLVSLPTMVTVTTPEQETAVILATEEVFGYINGNWAAYVNA
eukprot:TRINITY_DN23425_c0_g1_i2.p1 TRINITY_DN23425_c0_g1~~TRINITY_DN23425_c0_g1_i2.p1  ORF type:complete len:287 (+),score=99.48 TRINITY_DN23425_c0_g1_i2:117-863(+)